jgi:hypothetical protein
MYINIRIYTGGRAGIVSITTVALVATVTQYIYIFIYMHTCIYTDILAYKYIYVHKYTGGRGGIVSITTVALVATVNLYP